jgi:hypothetical protein
MRRSWFYDSDIIELATLSIFKCILAGGDCTRYLATALTNGSYQDAVGIFCRIIQLWLAYIENRDSHGIPLRGEWHVEASEYTRYTGTILRGSRLYQSIMASENFYTRAKSMLFWKIETAQRRIFPVNDRPLHNILNFIITAAKHSMVVRWGMLDAGILAMLPLALVDGVVSLLSGLLDVLMQQSNTLLPGHMSPEAETDSDEPNVTVISLAVINNGTSMLARCIQTPQFQELLHSEVFITRRSICSSLLDTFLGSEHAVDGTYSETRKLFAQILTERSICESGCSSGGMNASD